MRDIAAIVKGTSLPKPFNSDRSTKYPFSSMDVGDAFFLPDRTTEKFATYAAMWGRRLHKRFSTRTVWMHQDVEDGPWKQCSADTEGALKGVGVWRIE